jgi:RNA polymerase sigma factor (TIGR02999 family)
MQHQIDQRTPLLQPASGRILRNPQLLALMTAMDPPPRPTKEPASLGSTRDLFALLYRELHALAQRHLHNQGSGYTLGTTTLLHETYLKLSRRRGLRFSDRAQFLGYASRAMRGLVVDYARRHSAAKRGGEFHLLPLGQEEPPDPATDAQTIGELSDALEELAVADPGLAELVDLHFFCGLSFVEIAGLRGVSDRTIQRDWQKARLILHRTLHPAEVAADLGK